MISVYAPLFLGLVASAQSGGTEIFGPDRKTPAEIRTISQLDCSSDKAEIRYVTRPSGADELVNASINGRAVRKSDLSVINQQLVGNRISRVSWQECPTSKKDLSPVRLYLEFDAVGVKRFVVLLLSRDGTLRKSN